MSTKRNLDDHGFTGFSEKSRRAYNSTCAHSFHTNADRLRIFDQEVLPSDLCTSCLLVGDLSKYPEIQFARQHELCPRNNIHLSELTPGGDELDAGEVFGLSADHYETVALVFVPTLEGNFLLIHCNYLFHIIMPYVVFLFAARPLLFCTFLSVMLLVEADVKFLTKAARPLQLTRDHGVISFVQPAYAVGKSFAHLRYYILFSPTQLRSLNLRPFDVIHVVNAHQQDDGPWRRFRFPRNYIGDNFLHGKLNPAAIVFLQPLWFNKSIGCRCVAPSLEHLILDTQALAYKMANDDNHTFAISAFERFYTQRYVVNLGKVRLFFVFSRTVAVALVLRF
jgi:hypothetical protein